MQPRIGVCVTTHNRPDVRAEALEAWQEYRPAFCPLLLVDDASDEPAAGADHRFPVNVGIATAKNKSLELLDDAGVDHMFLSDDDAWPISPDWWRPYVASPLPHLMYLKGLERRRIWTDGQHWAAKQPRGGILYVHRTAVEKVGGMRTDFPRWGDEHVEWSRRIHSAGLTPHRYVDVVDSRHLWAYYKTQPSSVPLEERLGSAQLRRELLEKYDGTTDYVPYR